MMESPSIFNLPIKLKKLGSSSHFGPMAQDLAPNLSKIWNFLAFLSRQWQPHWLAELGGATGFPYSPLDFPIRHGTSSGQLFVIWAVLDMPQNPPINPQNPTKANLFGEKLFLHRHFVVWTFPPSLHGICHLCTGPKRDRTLKGGPCHQLQVGAHNSTHRGL